LAKSYHREGHTDQLKKDRMGWILPEEIVLEVADIADALREGLMAVGTKAAILIAEQLLEADVEAVVGPRGRHRKGRTASRHGKQSGFVVLGGRKVKIERPRARTIDGKEVDLQNYKRLQDGEFLDAVAMERMLYGVASRHYEKVSEPIFSELEAYGTSKSAVSERFAQATAELVGRFLSRDLSDERILVVFMDGIHMGDHTVLVALGVDAEGRKHVLGMREGTTENRAVCSAMLDDMVSRGLDAGHGLLFVVDGGKAIASAVKAAFGESALIQRCQVHKRKNIIEHLPEREERWVNEKLSLAWAEPDAGKAKEELLALARALEVSYPGAAASLLEGLEETLTVQRLRLPALLRRSLRTTNAIEAFNSQLRRSVRRVSRFSSGDQVIRWAGVAAMQAEPRLYRIAGYRQLPILAEALQAHAARLQETGARNSLMA